MYEITDADTGKRLQLCEHPTYIRWNENGSCYALSDEENATGVCANGTPYTLFGKSLQGTSGTAFVNPVDVGSVMMDIQAVASELGSQVTDAQMALCDVYEQVLAGEVI